MAIYFTKVGKRRETKQRVPDLQLDCDANSEVRKQVKINDLCNRATASSIDRTWAKAVLSGEAGNWLFISKPRCG